MPTPTTPATDVIFRKYPKSEGGDIIALFPADVATPDPYLCDSYQQVGQHGAADPQGVIASTVPAREPEYAGLKRELESAPYKYVLRVVKRCTARHLAARKQSLQDFAKVSA